MMQPTLYLTLGYPGSGKTYFAQKFAQHKNFFHLSADRLRLEMFQKPTYTTDEHAAVFRTMDYISSEVLNLGVSVVYDANVNKQFHRDQKRNIASRCNANTELLWFKVPPKLALERCTNREGGDNKYFRKISAEDFERLKDEIEEPVDEPYNAIDGTIPFNEQLKSLGT